MMRVTRRFLLSLPSLLAMIIALSGVGFAEDIPEKLREELDRGKTRLETEFKAAQETLLSSFDKKISNARTAPKLNGEEKQQLIGNIEAEKSNFETLGHIPFSPAMRTEAIEYLNKVQKAEIALAKIYDRAIESQTKQKNDEAARVLVADKKQAIEPKVVAKWSITDPKTNKAHGTWILWSNGSVIGQDRNHSWTLDQRRLAIRWQQREPPRNSWTDSFVLRSDAMLADVVDEKGVIGRSRTVVGR